jgi:hypothetical protein
MGYDHDRWAGDRDRDGDQDERVASGDRLGLFMRANQGGGPIGTPQLQERPTRQRLPAGAYIAPVRQGDRIFRRGLVVR